MIKDIITAYQAIKRERKRLEELEKIKNSPFTYAVIEDIVKSVAIFGNVKATITNKDGSMIVLEKQDILDTYRRSYE